MKNVLIGTGFFIAGVLLGTASGKKKKKSQLPTRSSGLEMPKAAPPCTVVSLPADGAVFASTGTPPELSRYDVAIPSDRLVVFRWALRHDRNDLVMCVARAEMEAQIASSDHPGEVLLKSSYRDALGGVYTEVAWKAPTTLANNIRPFETSLEYDGRSIPLIVTGEAIDLYTADCIQHAFEGRLGKKYEHILAPALKIRREYACGVARISEFYTISRRLTEGMAPMMAMTLGETVRYWASDSLRKASSGSALHAAMNGARAFMTVSLKESADASVAREQSWRTQRMLDYLTGAIDVSAVCGVMRCDQPVYTHGKQWGHCVDATWANAARRLDLIAWLEWNDPNGDYDDQDFESEGQYPLSRDEALELVLQQMSG